MSTGCGLHIRHLPRLRAGRPSALNKGTVAMRSVASACTMLASASRYAMRRCKTGRGWSGRNHAPPAPTGARWPRSRQSRLPCPAPCGRSPPGSARFRCRSWRPERCADRSGRLSSADALAWPTSVLPRPKSRIGKLTCPCPTAWMLSVKISLERLPVSSSTIPARPTSGNRPAVCTPILAVAAYSCASATAMSGRRRSRLAGVPGAMVGTAKRSTSGAVSTSGVT